MILKFAQKKYMRLMLLKKLK